MVCHILEKSKHSGDASRNKFIFKKKESPNYIYFNVMYMKWGI